jgi:Xaa-Pro aminopeptidase
MEALGEDHVGYTDTIKRNPQFGWRWLRLAKALEPGYVVTVEPGIYFIPALIDRRKAEHRYLEFIDYGLLDQYRDFGGIRIEDDVLVTDILRPGSGRAGYRILGKSIPKTTKDVEAACQTD